MSQLVVAVFCDWQQLYFTIKI